MYPVELEFFLKIDEECDLNKKPIVSLVQFTAANRGSNEPSRSMGNSKVVFSRNARGVRELGPRADQQHYAASSVERCISIANDSRSLPPHAAATIRVASRATCLLFGSGPRRTRRRNETSKAGGRPTPPR